MTLPERLLRPKPIVWLLIVLPGLWPAWPFFVRSDPSALADPLKFVLHHLGFVAAVLLVIVLTFSPLRSLFPHAGVVRALNRHRRLVGVSAFTYAFLHFLVHLWYEGGPAILASNLQKPFLVTGMIALLILFVLSVTSLQSAIRWLGGRRWKRLHRLVYVAAVLVAYHQIAARKVFPVQVLWLFGPLVALQIARLGQQVRERYRRSPARGPAAE